MTGAASSGENYKLVRSPALWNSNTSRRSFIKRAGTATIGVSISLNGLKTDVQASGSGEQRYYLVCTKAPNSPHTQDGNDNGLRSLQTSLKFEGPKKGTASRSWVTLRASSTSRFISLFTDLKAEASCTQKVELSSWQDRVDRPAVRYLENRVDSGRIKGTTLDGDIDSALGLRVVIESGFASAKGNVAGTDIGTFTFVLTPHGTGIEWSTPPILPDISTTPELVFEFTAMTADEYTGWCAEPENNITPVLPGVPIS